METSLSAQQRQYAEMCSRASQVLLRLVNDILDLTKVETGHLQLESKSFVFHEVVAKTVDLLTPRAEAKGSSLSCHIAKETPIHVQGDPDRLQQVLLNLIGNAITFTQQGQVLVRISQTPEESVRGLIRISIADSGIGIPHDRLETIFQRFTQVDPTASRQYGGVGLGLPICKRLIELMGGEIRVESEVGRWSSFTFTARLDVVKEAHRTVTVSTSNADGEAGPTNSTDAAHQPGLKILVVEDFPESQQLMLFYLQQTPHVVHVVDNGYSAIEKLNAGRYDLVLMDLQMPGMDGYTTTTTYRAWEVEQGLSRTPIVALTASALKETEQKSVEAGCSGFLTKPLTKARLLKTIASYGPRPETSPGSSPCVMSRDEQVTRIGQQLERMRPQFLQNRRQDVVSLRAALAVEDFEAMRTIGHRIKGLAGSYGYAAIGDIGHAIEQAAVARNRAAVEGQMKELTSAMDHLEPACERPIQAGTRS